MNATLKENVLFGQPRHTERYKHVISACALDPDIKVLPAGDMTEIGEKVRKNCSSYESLSCFLYVCISLQEAFVVSFDFLPSLTSIFICSTYKMYRRTDRHMNLFFNTGTFSR